MKHSIYVIGVDCGTSSTRAVLVDQSGQIAAETRKSYDSIHPGPGLVEQKASWWWDAFRESVSELMKTPPALNGEIRGIAITHQRITAVPVDAEMRPLRNAILWNDLRCGTQTREALGILGGEKIYKRTGYNPGIWTLYKVMWLRDNEPLIYEKTFKIMLVQDYIVHRLTGNLVTTSSSAVMTGALDVQNRESWAFDIIEGLKIRTDIWIEQVVKSGEIIGRVGRDAAEKTGLEAGLPVIAAAGDQPCGNLGAGIIKPGMAGINGGTSCTIEIFSEELRLCREAGFFVEISPMDGYYLENSIYSGGSALMNWLRNRIAAPGSNEIRMDWGDFYDMAKKAPAGNHGLMLVPYFSGASTPYWDLDARGVIFGLLTDHGIENFVRAIIEGLAYESRRQTEYMEKGTGNGRVKEVRMYGGSAKSALWNQIFSDIMNVKVVTTGTAETTALGAAICAAKGAGIYESFEEAVGKMVRIKDEFLPDGSRRKLYDELYERVYSKFYDRVHDLIHEATNIVRNI